MYKLLQKLKKAEQLYEYSREVTSSLYNRTFEIERELDSKFIESKLYFKMCELSLLEGYTISNISLAIDDTIMAFEFFDGCSIVDNHILATGKGEELHWNGTKYEGWLEDEFNSALGWCDVEIKEGLDYFELDWTSRKNLIKYSHNSVYQSPEHVYIDYKYISPMKYSYNELWDTNRMKFKVSSQGTEISRQKMDTVLLRRV